MYWAVHTIYFEIYATLMVLLMQQQKIDTIDTTGKFNFFCLKNKSPGRQLENNLL